MALLNIPLNQVDEARLQDLIAAGAAESRNIEYKRTIYGNAHADYSEFLADISSFANTSGGDLLLGIEATDGIPAAITPIAMPMEPEILRLDQVARGGLQPRANIAFHPVPIRAGGMFSPFASLVATILHTASFAREAIGFGHAQRPGSMSRMSMNSGCCSMLAPCSQNASKTSASIASPK